MEMKIAEALLLRKQLENKLKHLELIKEEDIFQVKTERRLIKEEQIEEVKTSTPKLSLKEVMAEYDKSSKQLRLLDGAIQQANWEHSVSLPDDFKADEE